jgi:O-antigen/teichoic acid export membrane protein
MIKIFIKYIIHSLWAYACKRAIRRGDPDYSKMLFNYEICILFFIIILIILLGVSPQFPTIKIKENFAYIIMCGLLTVIISAHILVYIINYEWIKKITITKKEKQLGGWMLIALICLTIIIKWIYKN